MNLMSNRSVDSLITKLIIKFTERIIKIVITRFIGILIDRMIGIFIYVKLWGLILESRFLGYLM